MKKMTFAVIMGTRDFFPVESVRASRKEVLNLLEEMDYDLVMLGEADTHLGAVETWEQAKKCAA